VDINTAEETFCSTGMNRLCCDPPDGSNSCPVDPKDLFKYPDEDDVNYYYNVEVTSNNEGEWTSTWLMTLHTLGHADAV
jgi:hypothetical protein